MTPQTEFLNTLCEAVETNCQLETEIALDELPAEGGVYAELGEGILSTRYYDKSAVRTIPVLFFCRDSDQQHGMGILADICNYLQRTKTYPQGTLFRWLNATTLKEPNKIGRDEGGAYKLSCIVSCQIYF